MYRYLLISLALMAYATPLCAQDFRLGLRGGYSLTGIGGQGLAANQNRDLLFRNGNLVSSQLTYVSSFHAGGYANVRVRERYAFEWGLFLSGRGYKYSYTETYLAFGPADEPIEGLATISEDYKAYYVDVPLLARTYVWRGFNLVLGLQPSLMVYNRLARNVAGAPRYVRSDADFRRFDVALVTGIGYDFPSGLNVNLTYDSGLVGVDKRLDLYQYHRVLKASVGYSFR